MADDELQVPCTECGEEFNPNSNEKRGWTCPHCRTRHPNLGLQYRILGYICAIGLAAILYMLIASVVHHDGFAWRHLLPVTQGILLLVALTVLLLRDQPWESGALRKTLWFVYASFLLFYLVEPVMIVLFLTPRMMTPGFLGVFVPFGAVLAGIGIYMGWIHVVTRRLTRGAEQD